MCCQPDFFYDRSVVFLIRVSVTRGDRLLSKWHALIQAPTFFMLVFRLSQQRPQKNVFRFKALSSLRAQSILGLSWIQFAVGLFQKAHHER